MTADVSAVRSGVRPEAAALQIQRSVRTHPARAAGVAAAEAPTGIAPAPSTRPAERIKAPAEWTIERRRPEECVADRVRIPVPARCVAFAVRAGNLLVGLRQVVGAQTAPAVESALLLSIHVELHRLELGVVRQI